MVIDFFSKYDKADIAHSNKVHIKIVFTLLQSVSFLQ